jgi:hypothetical protein
MSTVNMKIENKNSLDTTTKLWIEHTGFADQPDNFSEYFKKADNQ